MSLTPMEAYEAHVQQLRDGVVDAVIAGYAPDALMIANGEVRAGREAMRPLFASSRDGNSILDLEPTVDVTAHGDVVYARWRAARADEPDLVGSDTFVFADGQIVVHTGFYSPAA